MDYITAGEAAKKWGVSGRSITYHLIAGRIPGAVKKGKLWLIPADAQRPANKRRCGQECAEQSLSADLFYVLAATTIPMPNHDPDAVLDSVRRTGYGLSMRQSLPICGEILNGQCAATKEQKAMTRLDCAPAR